MAAASQNSVTVVVNQQDASGINILNRVIGAISQSGVAGQFTDGILTTTGATSITVPTTNIYTVVLQNTASTGNITVSWTPLAATGSVIAGKIQPGGALVLANPVSGASGAITALSLTSDLVNVTYQLFLGGA